MWFLSPSTFSILIEYLSISLISYYSAYAPPGHNNADYANDTSAEVEQWTPFAPLLHRL